MWRGAGRGGEGAGGLVGGCIVISFNLGAGFLPLPAPVLRHCDTHRAPIAGCWQATCEKFTCIEPTNVTAMGYVVTRIGSLEAQTIDVDAECAAGFEGTAVRYTHTRARTKREREKEGERQTQEAQTRDTEGNATGTGTGTDADIKAHKRKRTRI